ncbi:Motile sperm domain-containing protein 2 [Dermatophagoides farinae]|uniref:Motile sperm domain-containing protein 2 n=1 Tax=Dermatophagoides farinae TaxID=6954 RepID=A0A922HN72_DERFA|nr:Motile sperm domain-containing protein 2 [Dermatophagoides farinae]
MAMIQQHSSNDKSLTTANGITNNKVIIHTSKSAPLVAKIRQRFFENEWPKNAESYCEQDIERVRNSEWFVKRYLLQSRRNVEDAYELLISALRWRKEINFPNLDAKYFPREFFEIGGLFSYEPDRQGNPVIYLRIRMHKKIKDLEHFVKLFLFYTINRVDLESGENGCTIVFDCSGAGYSNMDLDLLKSLIDVAFKYFPYCIRLVIVYELSWMLNAFRKIAMTFVPSLLTSIIRFSNKNDINQYITSENLPDFMGGTCVRDYRAVPVNCRTIEEACLEVGISPEKAQQLLDQFEPFLRESREAIRARQLQFQTKMIDSNNSTIKSAIHESTNGDTNYVNEQNKETTNDDDDDNDDDEVMATTTTTTSSSSSLTTEQIALVHSPESKSFSHIATIYPQNVIHFKRRFLLKRNFDPEKENNFNQNMAKTVTNTMTTAAMTMMTTTTTTTTTTGNIMVRNNHQNRSLAFKIQSNCSDRYTVTPNRGVLLPRAFIAINIVRNTTADDENLDMDVDDDDIGKNPDLINGMNEIQDKFLILMSSTMLNAQMHLKNLNEFNKLFIKGIDDHQIYIHKLLVKFDNDNNDESFMNNNNDDDDNNMMMIHRRKRSTRPKMETFIDEMKRLRQKCRKLEHRQSWMNMLLIIMIMLTVIVLIWLFSFPSCLDFQ